MEVLKKIIILILVFVALGSCNKISKEFSLEGSCENDAKIFREIECLQIFERLPTLESYRLKSEGKHLITGEDCICDDGTRALARNADILQKGDTIIKRKGELTFSIHKRDTIIVVKWECEGKVYE